MRIASALRLTAGHLALQTRRTTGLWWTGQSLSSLAVLVCACALAGCGSELIDPEHARHISRERAALLKRQAPPRCEYRTVAFDDAGKRDGTASTNEANPDTATGAKLDYERQCYKHAEIIARARLTSLQGAVLESTKAGNRGASQSSPSR